MKTLTLLSATTLIVSAVFCANSQANELSAELQAATAQQISEQQPAMAQQAYQGMLQTVIDVKARLQAEQEASQLLVSQVVTAQATE